MIIFGTRARQVAQAAVPTTCTACKRPQRFLRVFQRYAHVFFIPVVPIGKAFSTVCAHCQSTRLSNEISEEERRAAPVVGGPFGAPAWAYSGLLILCVLFSIGAYQGYAAQTRTEEYLKAPKTGDVYIVSTRGAGSSDVYRLLRLNGVEDDALSFTSSRYEYPTRQAAERAFDDGKHKNEPFFSEEELTVKRPALSRLRVARILRE